ASRAAMEFDRPTDSGKNTDGYSTVLRSGTHGSVTRLSVEGVTSLLHRSTGLQFRVRGDLHEQHAVAVLGRDAGAIEAARQFQRPLEPAVGDLQPVVLASLVSGAVAAYAPHRELAPPEADLDILGPHAGQVELDQVTLPRLVDVRGGAPRSL